MRGKHWLRYFVLKYLTSFVYFQPSDHFIRVEEAVLRSVVSSIVNSSVPSASDRILNPNEVIISILYSD